MSSKIMGLPQKIDRSRIHRMYEGIEYKDFWSEDKRKHTLDLLEHTLVGSLIPTSGHRIVDLGCGFGRLSDCYLDRFEQVVMVDGSMTLLQQAQETTQGRATYIAADANHLPFRPSSFDCVLLFRVFHHIPNSQAIMSEVNRILGLKGIFVFNYCNKLSPRQIVRWILRLRHDNPFNFSPAGVGTRFISHHPRHVYKLLKQNRYSNFHRLGSVIVDKIPDPFGILLPFAQWLAPVSGFANTASWISYSVKKPSGEAIDKSCAVEKIFICPSCHGDLIHRPGAYTCKSCASTYPIKNGIIDFRLDSNEDF